MQVLTKVGYVGLKVDPKRRHRNLNLPHANPKVMMEPVETCWFEQRRVSSV